MSQEQIFADDYDGPVLSVMAAIYNSVDKSLGHTPEQLYIDAGLYKAWAKGYGGRNGQVSLFRGIEVVSL